MLLSLMEYRTSLLSRLLICLIFSFLFTLVCVFYVKTEGLDAKRTRFIQSDQGLRLRGLLLVKDALAKYYQDHHSYPLSEGYQSVVSCWGRSISPWIPELVPSYLSELPTEKHEPQSCAYQYYYFSDGKDYKIISNQPDDFNNVVSLFPEVFDSRRPYYAYGFWTEGASKF